MKTGSKGIIMKFTLQNKLGALALSVLTLLGTIPAPILFVGATATVISTTGCNNGITPAQMAADGAAVANAVLAMAKITTDPTLASNLIIAAGGLVKATADWQTGSSTAEINDAAGIVEVVLADIPPSAAYALLVPIAVAALDIILANTTATTATPSNLMSMAVRVRVAKVAKVHPYRKPVTFKHIWGRSPAGDFKATWNDMATKIKLTTVRI